MNVTTHVLLLGRASRADGKIARTVERWWPGARLHLAADAITAISVLKEGSDLPWPVSPDLVIVKVPRPEFAKVEDFEDIRGYKPLRDSLIAAFIEGPRTGQFRCMRGAGLTAVLTEESLDDQLAGMADAVVGNWIAPSHVDCGERYFCPSCIRCVIAAKVAVCT
jgi:hypothetical protein